MQDKKKFFFSIIIPIAEVNEYLKENLSKIKLLKNSNWETLVLPNNLEFNQSRDKNNKIKFIETGKVSPALKRDIGAKNARGNILVFLDDDSYPDDNFLKNASKYFCDNNIVAIGGPGVTPENNSFFQKLSGAVFLSKFSGGFPERYFSIKKQKSLKDWPTVNLMIRKEFFIKIGGFNTKFWPGEDTILCEKISKIKGRKFEYAYDVIVWHHRRKNLLEHIDQILKYALHRGFFFRLGLNNSRKFIFLLPSMLLIYVLLIPAFLSTKYEFLFFPIFIYLIVVLISIVEIFFRTSFFISLCSIPLIIITHMTYGYGFIKGIFSKELFSKLR